jgi:hypothetical protein
VEAGGFSQAVAWFRGFGGSGSVRCAAAGEESMANYQTGTYERIYQQDSRGCSDITSVILWLGRKAFHPE